MHSKRLPPGVRGAETEEEDDEEVDLDKAKGAEKLGGRCPYLIGVWAGVTHGDGVVAREDATAAW